MFERAAQEHFEKSHRVQTWDVLLDSYVEWRNTHAKEARRKLLRAARELKRIDPAFSLKAFRERWALKGRGDPPPA